MIGRSRPYRAYELDRWVRGLVATHGVTATEHHVALYLCSRAKDEQVGPWWCATCWPSVGLIAKECGYKVKRVQRKGGRIEETNSTIAAALAELERKQVIYSEQSGRRGASREFLFNPDASPTDQPVGGGPVETASPSDRPDLAHRPVGGEVPPANKPPTAEETKQQNKPESSPPTDRWAGLPTDRRAENGNGNGSDEGRRRDAPRRLDPLAALRQVAPPEGALT